MTIELLAYKPGMKFDYHDVADLFPPMEESEFADLVNDVALHGVRTAVWMHAGKIVDGRHRSRAWLRACEEEADKPEVIPLECPGCVRRWNELSKSAKELQPSPPPLRVERAQAGQTVECPRCREDYERELADAKARGKKEPKPPEPIEIPITLVRRQVPPLPVCQWDGQGSLIEFVFSLNVHRRHLEPFDRAELVLKAAGWIEEEARLRQKAGTLATAVAKGKTAEKLAKIARVSRGAMEKAKRIKVKGSKDLQDALRGKKISMSKAAALAKLSPAKQLAAIKREASRTRATNRRLDLQESLERWTKLVRKLHRQMSAHDPAVPELVTWAEQGLKLLEEKAG